MSREVSERAARQRKYQTRGAHLHNLASVLSDYSATCATQRSTAATHSLDRSFDSRDVKKLARACVEARKATNGAACRESSNQASANAPVGGEDFVRRACAHNVAFARA